MKPRIPGTSLANWLRRRAALGAALSVLGLILPLLAGRLGESSNRLVWLLDLAMHWQWLFLSLLLLTCTIQLATRQRAWAWCLLAAPLPWLTASSALPPLQGEAQGVPILSIASANVHFENRDVQPLRQWLQQEKPDLLLLLEISPDYAAALQKEGLADYPYRTILAEDSPFGMALLSRQVLLQANVLRDAEGMAHIEAQLEFHGQRIALAAIHPMPPLSPEYHTARNRKIMRLIDAAQDNAHPALIAGDFNATPWSSAFVHGEKRGWRRATGLASTWPAAGRGLFGIPIDHILASPGWRLQGSSLGPSLGSDHLPVLVRLFLPEAVRNKAEPGRERPAEAQ